jgi:hypothetical protein
VALARSRATSYAIVVHDAAVTVFAAIGIRALIALRLPLARLFSLRYRLVVALVGAGGALGTVIACLGPIRQAVRASPVGVLRVCCISVSARRASVLRGENSCAARAHEICPTRTEVRVVLDPVRVIHVLARPQLEKQRT